MTSNFLTNPAFFDIFGFIAFVFLIIIAIYGLKHKNTLPKWILILLLILGIIGAIVDIIFSIRFLTQ